MADDPVATAARRRAVAAALAGGIGGVVAVNLILWLGHLGAYA